MKFVSLPAFLVAYLSLIACAPVTSAPQEIILVPPDAAVRVSSAYWIDQDHACRSILREVASVRADQASTEGLEFSLSRGQVARTRPNQCGGIDVPAAFFLVRQISPVSAEQTRLVRYIVSYDTEIGTTTSSHERHLRLLPAANSAAIRN